MTISRRIMFLALGAVAAPLPALARQRRSRVDPPSASSPLRTLSFGPDPLQSYDLFADDGAGPILLFVHGGGWSRGDRSSVNALPDYARRHGLTLASTAYRLAPAVTARESAMDVAAAVADLKRRHPGRSIWLLGHSAGAHLCALVATDPDYLAASGASPSDLAGVILLDGAGYDATAPRNAGRMDQWLGRTYDQAFGDQAAALSPTLRVRRGVRYPPFLIFYVSRRADAVSQGRGLAEALNRSGHMAEMVAAPNDSHMTINRGFGVRGDPEGEYAARFIARRSHVPG